MKKRSGGGAGTRTGSKYEDKVGLHKKLKGFRGYKLATKRGRAGVFVSYRAKNVARYFRHHEFYRFLKELGVSWKDKVSAKLLPDGALVICSKRKLFIIEMKTQGGSGSVDEKLQTCDFKRRQFRKLVGRRFKVEYCYLLDAKWFKSEKNQRKYKDVLEYINAVGCHYFFDEIPLTWLGLPVPSRRRVK